MQRRTLLKALACGAVAGHLPRLNAEPAKMEVDMVKDYLHRMRQPDRHYDGDVRANLQTHRTLLSVTQRLKRVQQLIGYGNFNVVSFDDALIYSRRYSKIGRFKTHESELIEQLFYEDASHYGFLGRKPVNNLTESINKREIVKVPRTGHYLYRGKPYNTYREISRELGDEITLTSGIRGVVKQMHLFLAKASKNQGNLSLASRSLAPPGYSFHGIGDFDVGKPGWGYRNFSEDFATTDVFKKLIDLGYIDIRYPLDNHLGVRFEPWHIKVS